MASLRVAMVIIDAMPHRHVGAALTPHLWSQVELGGWAPDGGRSLPVSVTYANHAAFVTGVDPSVTGVYGNHTWVRDADGAGGWVSSPKAGPRAATLFDRVADAGGRSVAIVGDHKLVGQMGAGRADHVWPPDGWIPEGTPRCEFGYPTDSAVVAAAREADLDADLVVLHLNQPDTTSHLYGPDSAEAIARYAATDAAYGELIDLLRPGWSDTVVITLSDHDQETVDDQTPIGLADALAAYPDIEIATEGTAALLHGPIDAAALATALAVPGVDGARRLSPDVWTVWSRPGRVFDQAPIPLLGQHGSPRCRTQVAIVSGGHPRVAELAARLVDHRPRATDWAPLVTELLGLEVPV